MSVIYNNYKHFQAHKPCDFSDPAPLEVYTTNADIFWHFYG